MKVQIITLFPEMFDGVLNSSMLWKAQKNKLAQFELVNLRVFGLGPRRTVDDTPYGGGAGMLLKPEPIVAAIEHAKKQTNHKKPIVILMTPRGETFNQKKAVELSRVDDVILVCARYEGYDERVTEYVDQQISIGDYILTGGELPAMLVIDSVIRLIPGVLGGETSTQNESFSDGQTLEHPQYTRPETFRGVSVPKVLLEGNHAQIKKWREKNSHLKNTQIT